MVIIILILQIQSGTITVKASRREAEIIGTTWTESLPFGRPTNNNDLFTTKQTKKHPPMDGDVFLLLFLLLMFKNAYFGNIAVFFVKVQTVPDDELVGNNETGIFGVNVALSAFGFV